MKAQPRATNTDSFQDLLTLICSLGSNVISSLYSAVPFLQEFRVNIDKTLVSSESRWAIKGKGDKGNIDRQETIDRRP